MDFPDEASRLDLVSHNRDSSKSMIVSPAPAFKKADAAALPIPDAPPVTMACLPASPSQDAIGFELDPPSGNFTCLTVIGCLRLPYCTHAQHGSGYCGGRVVSPRLERPEAASWAFRSKLSKQKQRQRPHYAHQQTQTLRHRHQTPNTSLPPAHIQLHTSALRGLNRPKEAGPG